MKKTTVKLKTVIYIFMILIVLFISNMVDLTVMSDNQIETFIGFNITLILSILFLLYINLTDK